MLDLTAEQIVALPVDRLALLVLADLVATKEWNEYNYIQHVQMEFERDEVPTAAAEATGWLRARGLISRKPGVSESSAIQVTRLGHRVLADGPSIVYAMEHLHEGLHPLAEAKARPQFMLGEYEQAVFSSMKAVEIRVRQLGGFGDDATGIDLMNRAFSATDGPLSDSAAVKGEREGVRALFAGAYAVLRNPAGHREVDYDDIAEAAEAVATASLLMRVLDRVEQRLARDE